MIDLNAKPFLEKTKEQQKKIRNKVKEIKLYLKSLKKPKKNK